jgi:hypothetical protein
MDFVFDGQQGNLQKVVTGIVQGKVAEASFAYVFLDGEDNGAQKGLSLFHTFLTTVIAVVKSLNWSSTAFNYTPENGAPSTPRSRASSSVTTPDGKRPRASPFAITPKTTRPAAAAGNESDGTLNHDDLAPPPPKRAFGKGNGAKKNSQ